MYNIKVMGNRVEEIQGEDILVDFENMYKCGHYGVTHFPPDASEATKKLFPAGVEFRIELSCAEGMITINLPQNGQEIYIMNEIGDTIDSHKCEGTR